MLINVNFNEDDLPGARDGGPIECPVCSFQGGYVESVMTRDDETFITFGCYQGHRYELTISSIDDSIGTLAWTMQKLLDEQWEEEEWEDEE